MASEMQLTLVAGLLRRGRGLDLLSNALTLLALAYGLAPLLGTPPSAASAVICGLLVMLGLAQKYWAIRVALDAELFARLADDLGRLVSRTTELDQALHNLGLQPASAQPRDWQERSRAAIRLLRLQVAWLVAQLLLALVVILAIPWLSLAG
ncbi:hypothetical protein [Aquipseudomonas alcaligenes]|uniref:Transmembrane protein n=1 Tax=Aquipseudomonas alcaligenes TaxID=43263 RepID=A0A1N6N9M2_AQUAC|nr:hypothetical protein [Pseudomonas alcaligenes]SIP88761.1 hypothetical protein SAMN05878282_101162 [Pseudomonas alcaligenes]